PRRQKPSQDTNAQLIDLLNKHSNRELTDLELALQCGKAVKTQLSRGRQYYHHMWYTLPWPFDEFFHEYAPYKWITKVQVFEIPSKKMATMDQSSLRSLDASGQTLSSSTCTLPYVAFSDCIETDFGFCFRRKFDSSDDKIETAFEDHTKFIQQLCHRILQLSFDKPPYYSIEDDACGLTMWF
ncbi:unnamed protein product, partial [Rotaria socialis]